MYEENLKEESIHNLSKSTDHFEEDQVVKAIQKKNNTRRYYKNNITVGSAICLSSVVGNFLAVLEAVFE
jgi:hypothetical protein